MLSSVYYFEGCNDAEVRPHPWELWEFWGGVPGCCKLILNRGNAPVGGEADLIRQSGV